MHKPLETKIDKPLAVLLSDYGYRFGDGILSLKKSCPFSGKTTIGRFSGIHAACCYLIPIIRENNYRERFNKICN